MDIESHSSHTDALGWPQSQFHFVLNALKKTNVLPELFPINIMWTSKLGTAITTDRCCLLQVLSSYSRLLNTGFWGCQLSLLLPVVLWHFVSVLRAPGGEGHLELRQVTEAGESMQHHPNLPGRTPTTGTELNDKLKDKSSCFSSSLDRTHESIRGK